MKSNRTNIFIYNVITSTIYQIIVMIAGIIIPRIMIVYYGSEINGLVTSIVQFMSYFSLVEAGLANASVYALFKPIANNDNNKINAVMSAVKKMYNKSGNMFSILSLIFMIIFPFVTSTEVLDSFHMMILIFVIAASTSLDFFTLGKYRVLLTADQKVYILSLVSVLYTIINTTIIVVLSMINADIILVRFASLLAVIIRTLMLRSVMKHHYKFLDYSVKPDFEALNKRKDAMILNILTSIHMGAGVVILTVFGENFKTVSVYTIYNMVILGVNGIIGIFVNGLGSSFGEIIVKGEEDTLKKAYDEFELIYYIITSFLFSVTMVMIIPFIKLYTRGITDTNYVLPIIGAAFVIDSLLFNLKGPQAMMVTSSGMFKETKLQSLIQGGIKVLGGIILVKPMGIPGVLIASILSNIYRDIELVIFASKRITNANKGITVKRIIIVFISMALICITAQFIYVEITTVQTWLLVSIVYSAYAMLVIIILNLIFDKHTLINIYQRICRVLKLAKRR